MFLSPGFIRSAGTAGDQGYVDEDIFVSRHFAKPPVRCSVFLCFSSEKIRKCFFMSHSKNGNDLFA